jgi:MFS family permease
MLTGMLPLFVLAHFGHHLLTALPTPLLPLIRKEYNLDYTQSGLVYSAFSLSYGFGQLPAGWIADRIGRRIIITIGICGVAVAGLLVGLSQNYIMMIIFLALMGVMGGGYHPASPPLVAASVEPENRGSALGFHLIGGSASYFLSPLVASAIAVVWGWRGAFITLSIPTMIFGIVFYVMIGRMLQRKKTVADTKEGKTIHESRSVSHPGNTRRLISFIVLVTSISGIAMSIQSFIPLLLVDKFGVAEEAAGAYLAITFSCGLWVSPIAGYLSDRLGKVPLILGACLIAAPTIYLFTVVPFRFGIPALLVVLGIVQFIRLPLAESYIIGHTSERNRSLILGIYYFTAMEGSGVLAPVVGILIDNFGYNLTFGIGGAFILTVTLICALLLRGGYD